MAVENGSYYSAQGSTDSRERGELGFSVQGNYDSMMILGICKGLMLGSFMPVP